MRPGFTHIAIEGTIGVGKSTVARLLASRLDAQLLLEQPQDNPFLERYYADGSRYAFQAQLFFFFQRIEQMRELLQPGMFTPCVVSDFMFDKDELFARLTLSDDEYRLYGQVHRQMAPRVRRPDLVIWLQAPVEVLMHRIQRRGIHMEQGIDPAYLSRISAAYGDYFDRNPDLPVFVVHSERFNPVECPSDIDALLQQLARYQGPREEFDGAALRTFT